MAIQKTGTSQSAGDQTIGPGDINISVNLSRDNSVFGSSSTVQTASLRTLVLVRAY